MSYDLFFVERDFDLTREAFKAYFTNRLHYEVTANQTWYTNEDTGVYFSFDLGGDVGETGERAENTQGTAASAVVSFSLNLNRPTYFSMEAALEVHQFVRTFCLSVFDPQVDNNPNNDFGTETFLRTWQETNRIACSAVREGDNAVPKTYARDALLRIWEWNFARETLQRAVGEDIFIPKISFGWASESVKSFVVWTDGIASFIPEVDVVLLLRNQHRSEQASDVEILMAPWAQVGALVREYPVSSSPIVHYQLRYSEPPLPILRFFRERHARITKEDFVIIGADSVLDSEYFA